MLSGTSAGGGLGNDMELELCGQVSPFSRMRRSMSAWVDRCCTRALFIDMQEGALFMGVQERAERRC